jgi:hypothetical protein
VRSLEFDPAAFEDLAWWIARGRKIALRVVKLVQDEVPASLGRLSTSCLLSWRHHSNQ